MSKKKTSLACSVCGSRNYSKNISDGQRTKRLEIKKFCKTCQGQTLHKATK